MALKRIRLADLTADVLGELPADLELFDTPSEDTLANLSVPQLTAWIDFLADKDSNSYPDDLVDLLTTTRQNHHSYRPDDGI